MAAAPTYLIGLGATKAGTSWFYDHLAGHPECYFRTIKELHYFSMHQPQHFDRALDEVGKSVDWVKARQQVAPADRQAYLAQRLVDLAAWGRVLGRREIDLDAYRAYVTEAAGEARLVGDVTPAYSLMPKDRLQSMTGVSGQMRFVYLIRDPLARLWSHVRMIASRVKDPTGFAAEAVACLNRILSGDLSGEGAGIVARGDYARIIPKLKRAFGARDLWIQCQEEMMTVPGLQRLSAFLGLTPKLDGLDKRVHEGQALALPEDLANRARAWLRPQYEFAATALPVLPEVWRRNIEKGFA